MGGTFDYVMAALSVVAAVWMLIFTPFVILALFGIRSNRALCSESDAIIAEAEAGELRRLAVAHG